MAGSLSSIPDATRQMDVQLRLSYAHNGVVCCVKFSLDGSLLAVGTDNAVVLYNLERQTKMTFSLSGENESAEGRKANHVRSVIISPDNKLLVGGSEDKFIRVWNLETGEFIRTLSGHRGEVYALAFTSDSRTLLSASGDSTVRLWDATQFSADATEFPEPLCRVLRPASTEEKLSKLAFTSVSVDASGSFVAAGSLDGTIRVWDTRSGLGKEEPVGVLQGHTDGVYGIQFSPSDSGSSVMSLRERESGSNFEALGDLARRETVYLQEDVKWTQASDLGYLLQDAVLSASLIHLGREQRLASSSRDGTVRLWDLKTGLPYFMIQGHTNTGRRFSPCSTPTAVSDAQFIPEVTSVDLSSDGTLLASGSGDREVRIWRYILQ
ncbi:WD40-repeat-containing domain protein [Melanogaster broomeanus]|nr:WD40-repeat-containing domain protein [Melanogaster broomeanus]